MLNRCWILGLIGCADKSYAPCQQWRESEAVGFETSVGDLSVQVVPPESPDVERGVPTAVFIPGGWPPNEIPIDEQDPMLRDTLDYASIHFGLPNDLRGERSRNAVASILDYATGRISDDEGCSLDERLPTGIDPRTVLAGFSNGGNLAWSTAGDSNQDIVGLVGIATFETPMAATFILGEPGTAARPNPRFDPTHCDFDDALHMSCPFGIADLAFADAESCEVDGGCLFLDANDDGFPNGIEKRMGSVFDPESGRHVHSQWVTAAAESRGILPGNRADSSTASAFWQTREATQAMRSVADRFPDLGGISTGTRVDHVLNNMGHSVHVTAMVQAMMQSGIAYARLHPGAEWMTRLHGDRFDWEDNPVNEAVSLDAAMEPEDDVTVRGTDYLAAAVTELLDRSRTLDASKRAP